VKGWFYEDAVPHHILDRILEVLCIKVSVDISKAQTELLQLHELVDLGVCFTGDVQIRVILALRNHELDVPEFIAVVGSMYGDVLALRTDKVVVDSDVLGYVVLSMAVKVSSLVTRRKGDLLGIDLGAFLILSPVFFSDSSPLSGKLVHFDLQILLEVVFVG
jgi:hypothetical protein